ARRRDRRTRRRVAAGRGARLRLYGQRGVGHRVGPIAGGGWHHLGFPGADLMDKQRWLVVVLYSAAMAYVEAAVVLYLRTMVNRLDPYQPPPVDLSEGLLHAEMVREATTLIMLFAVGWLAGRTWRSRLGYMLVAFGVWDILYYVFLVPLSGWPRSLLDWDILFLLPLPWCGPVLAPVSIGALMSARGMVACLAGCPERRLWPGRCAPVLA